MPLEIQASGPSYQGFLVIDSVVHRTSSGGVRITADLEIQEIRDLAREMSLKYAWCRLPRGGAKAGLRLHRDLSGDGRRRSLEGFGRDLAPLIHAGLYNPGMDLGCSADDLQAIYRGAGIALGRPTDTSYFTAITVASAVQAWADVHPGPLPRTLAIEGFGNVALHLATLLPEDRFRIVAVATEAGGVSREEGFSSAELTRGRAAHGDLLIHHLPGRPMAREDVARVPADLFVPAARTRSIGGEQAAALSARAVIPIANAPYQEGVPVRLQDRGIVCLPGFVSNCGGVFASSLFDSGVSREEIDVIFGAGYRRIVTRLLSVSQNLGRSPVETASEIARRALEIRQGPPSSRGLLEKLRFRASRRLPKALRARAARQQCLESLRLLDEDLAALAKP